MKLVRTISLKEESFSVDDIIDPDWVIRYLMNHLPDGKISAEQVYKVVKRMSNKIKGVRVEFEKNRKAKNCVIVSGLFDTDRKNSIILTLTSSGFKKSLNLNKRLYNQMLYDIADTVCHESIHRYQHRIRDDEYFRGHSSDDVLNYYADPDEMFAYSVNIAHSLYRQFGDDTDRELSNFPSVVDRDFYLADYFNLFHNQKVFKKLMKMIYLNVLAIKAGNVCYRPYAGF